MFSSWRLLCLCWAVVAFSMVRAENDTCPLNWIFIDIHYRAVDARPDTFSYGLFIGAGINSQNQSLWPAISQNETRLASNNFCGNGSPAQCSDPKYTHGHFGADSSASWQPTPQYTTLDVDNADDKVMNVTYGTETLNIFTHFIDPSPPSENSVENHPITVMSDYTSDQDVFFQSGSVGFGPSSTLLKELVDDGKIGRNVVGFYLGTAYPRAGGIQNGSIVLGGYDAGRVDGEPHEYPLVPAPAPSASPFKVHVKQMSLVTRDNSSIGLVTDDGFDGYISSNQYAIELPNEILSRLATALAASPSNDAENVLQLPEGFDGNLTITLDDGYQITYPAEWISNNSGISPFSASSLNTTNTTTADGPLIFGAAFLHHLYMTIDYDAQKFSLADARVANNYVMPRSLCPNTLPAAIGPPQLSKFVQKGMVGAILGGLIGGLGLACFLFFCLRRHYQHKQSKQAIRKTENGGTAMPKKSSLRSQAKRGFVRFAKTKDVNDVEAGNVKRVSFTDSDTSSDKGVSVTVTDKDAQRSLGIEMTRIKSRNAQRPDSRLSDADTLHDVPLTSRQDQGQIRQTAVQMPLPTPDQFTNPFASPLPTPGETPRTGNPLLGNYRGFVDYADDDDTDLEPQHRKGHRRTPSEQVRRSELGLKIDTSVKPGKTAQEVTASRSLMGRHKPAPLPLDVMAGSRDRKSSIVKSEADYVKSNPVRALFGKGSGGSNVTKPSTLRKMFPPPRS